MTTSTPLVPPAATAVRARGGLGRTLALALRTVRGRIGLGLTLAVVLLAAVGPFVAPHGYADFTGAPYAPPGTGLLGTDSLGRDVWSRVLTGGWELLILAAVSTGAAVTVGCALGVVAAYRQRLVGGLTMRGVDILLSVPQLVFVLLIVSVVGSDDWILVVAVALVQAPQTARVMYAAAQDVTERDFVKVVELWRVPARTVIWRQVMPNLVTPLTVEVGLRLSYSIILIAGLNFLGFGVQPPAPSWGVMVNENRLGLSANPWGLLAPAILLGILAVGTNVLADAIARANSGETRTLETPEASKP